MISLYRTVRYSLPKFERMSTVRVPCTPNNARPRHGGFLRVNDQASPKRTFALPPAVLDERLALPAAPIFTEPRSVVGWPKRQSAAAL
jgi:hypothetical protein